MDDAIGQVMAGVDKMGLDEDTAMVSAHTQMHVHAHTHTHTHTYTHALTRTHIHTRREIRMHAPVHVTHT